MLDMILKGGYRTPNHPKNKKQRDDMHEVKEEILARITEAVYESDVGKNPNIAIDGKSKTITLEGVGPFKGRKHETDIPADDYFVKISFVSKDHEIFHRVLQRPNIFILPCSPNLIADTVIDQMELGEYQKIHIIVRV
ncbi:hypothetical protein [Vibrio harveyi]|uniref:hypothetical protein n=1 Tax=Vibrio harveyi TaxID=669 RepID=UPI00165E1A7B|nr:hypothetical protein [Vibrio harveyi]